MPHNQDTEHPRTSQAKTLDRPGYHFRPKRFSVSPWVHRWAFTGGRNASDARLLQSARAIKRWHGGAYAPVGERNRAICDASRLTREPSRVVVEQANDAYLWQLAPIRERQCRNVIADHSECHLLPDSTPCRRAAILEIAFDSDPVIPHEPTSDERFTLEAVGTTNPVPTASIGIGITGAPEPTRRFRTIQTRYGRLGFTRPDIPPRACSL